MQKKKLQEGDLVLCTVTKIQPPIVWVKLDKYQVEGMIHFAEIAPGRIRNIRDYVVPNKLIVCKVLRVSPHLELSLRRVKAKERNELLEQYKKEKICLNLLNLVIKDKQRINQIAEKWGLANFLDNFSRLRKESLLSKAEIEELAKLIKEKCKEKVIKVEKNLHLSLLNENGVDLIKEAAKKAEKYAKLIYLGAGKYLITVETQDKKEALKLLEKALTSFIEPLKKAGADVTILNE